MPKDVFVHPAALVDTDDVGSGTRVWAFAHIMDGASVGRDCNVGDHAFIESGAVVGDRVTVKNGCLIWHGVHIGDDAFVGPNVVFTNDLLPRSRYQTTAEDWLETDIAERATLGANSTILSGIRVGLNAFVGAGAVVTKDVPDHALVTGNPARHQGWVCDCGHKLDDGFVCAKCGRTYEEFDSGLRESGPTQ